MIEEQGRVVAIRDNRVWVQTERHTTCGDCSAQAGCGQGLFAKMSQRSHNHIEVVTDRIVAVGDRVVLGIAENTLVKSSLWAYGLPLVMMIAAAVIAESVPGLSEPWVIGAALLGLAAGMLVTRLHSFRASNRSEYQPVLLRVVPETNPGIDPATATALSGAKGS